MKRIKYIFLPVIIIPIMVYGLLSNCTGSDKFPNQAPVEVIVDTFDLEVIGNLRKVAKYKEKYYCVFETKRQHTTRNFKKMIALDKAGRFVEDVFLPDGIQDMSYFSFFLEEDSLFLKRDQFDEENFLLKEYAAEFKLMKRRDFPIYEDSLYRIFSSCQGEWGGTIFFENKETGEFFEGKSTCIEMVKKIGQDYYVLNNLAHLMYSTSILKISAPQELSPSDGNLHIDFHSSKSMKGIEGLFYEEEFYIHTLISINEQLAVIYSDDKGTFIGKVEDEKIIPIYAFDFRFFAHFHQQIDDQRQVLTFFTPWNKQQGILEINGRLMKFHIIK